MKGRQAVIVTTAEEACAASQEKDAAGRLYLASNMDTDKACRDRGWESLLLDEETIVSEFSRLNRWALDQVLRFIKKFSGREEQKDLLESQLLNIRSAFIQLPKFFRILDVLIRENDIKEIFSYNAERNPALKICQMYAAERHPGIRWQDQTLKIRTGPRKRTGWKPLLFSAMARLSTTRTLRSLRKKKPEKIAVISGSLKLFSGLLNEELLEGYTLVCLENNFSWEQYRFCRQKGILYAVTGPGKPAAPLFSSEDLIFKKGEVEYPGMDLSRYYSALFGEFVRTGQFDPVLKNTFGYMMDAEMIREFYREFRPEWTLLDEDAALRRIIAIIADKENCACYVVSHGIPAVQSQARPNEEVYFSSKIFVQAPVDARAYENLCFDPAKIIVSGEPRFDYVATAARNTSLAGKKKDKTILYCGSSFDEYDFFCLSLPIVGLNNFLRRFTEIYLADTLDILKEYKNIALQIKPHYNDECKWEAWIKRLAFPGLKYEIISHQKDILDHLPGADVVVTPESSVIREALFFRKPIVVFNYSKSPMSIGRYSEDGVIAEVRDKGSYQRALSGFLGDPSSYSALLASQERHRDYYEGTVDGVAAHRIASILRSGR